MDFGSVIVGSNPTATTFCYKIEWSFYMEYVEEKKRGRPKVKCSPFVRQCGIIEIYQLKSLTKGSIFYAKRTAEQKIHAGI